MSIFDRLKKAAATTPTETDAAAVHKKAFSFLALPESLAEMQALPEAALEDPFQTAALTVCALCAYAADKCIGTKMLTWLRGPRPLSPHDLSFLNESVAADYDKEFPLGIVPMLAFGNTGF